ncbi:hypothetical protein CBM2633_A70114 [Cupriavidus taiwanensis]|nr:hypothetical protein CBM2633_A70114 [Cupriavidus taiwanensis]
MITIANFNSLIQRYGVRCETNWHFRLSCP